MIFKFRLLSAEVNDFVRDIEIRSDQTFYDFHKTIQEILGWDKSQMASFFLSNDDWEKGTEITLMEMFDDEFSESIVMDVALMSEFIKEKHQKLLYVFDFFTERYFFVEMVQTYKDTDDKYPRCIKSEGDPPQQLLIEDFSSDSSFNEDFDDDIEDLGFDNIDDFDNI